MSMGVGVRRGGFVAQCSYFTQAGVSNDEEQGSHSKELHGNGGPVIHPLHSGHQQVPKWLTEVKPRRPYTTPPHLTAYPKATCPLQSCPFDEVNPYTPPGQCAKGHTPSVRKLAQSPSLTRPIAVDISSWDDSSGDSQRSQKHPPPPTMHPGLLKLRQGDRRSTSLAGSGSTVTMTRHGSRPTEQLQLILPK